MRILHLIDSRGVYGAERILLYLAREQQRRGHEPWIVSIGDPGSGESEFEALARARGIAVAPVRIAPRPTPSVVRSLLRTVRALRPDVLHSHGYKANILLSLVSRRRRGPMLATLHGWTSGERLGALWLYERLDRWALRRLDAVVVVARGMLTLPALRAIPPDRVHVIANGIPTRAERRGEPGAELPQQLLDFLRRGPTLVAIGRLSAEKGFALLLESFVRARDAAGKWQLLIVGEGPERPTLAKRIASLGLQDAVRLGGYVGGADRLLGEAAGFVMSSFTEGMPLVLLEALQWPVPIIATRVGAIPELLGERPRARLVPPRDGPALAAALQDLMSAPPALLPSASPDTGQGSAAMAQAYLQLYAAIT
ncbi:MAG TPA: glycosyltransferase [Steroidobacteraceae bacterium]|jgi:glycosyltransferase involved in cell wall biosynthesis|nr:glycosyltransferase [Steroidobacteraceae bacterium]